MDISPFSQTLQGSPYIQVGFRTLNGRKISKFLIDNEMDNALSLAVGAIQNLLIAHTDLIATFDRSEDQIRIEVERNRYLIINNRAVCFAEQCSSPEGASRNFIDRLFSENLLDEPVACTREHYFEKRRLEFWIKEAGKKCPLGEDHTIKDPVSVDEEVLEEIQRFKNHNRNQENLQDRLFANMKAMELMNIEMMERSRLLSQVDPINAFGGTGKIAFKAGSKHLGEEIAKRIPGISLLIGLSLGYSRCLKGEYSMAAAELASGVAASIPTYGTAISITLDGAIFAYDLRDPVKKWYYRSEWAEKAYYKILEIDIDKNPNPTKEQVDTAFRQIAKKIHPDKANDLGKLTREDLEKLTQILNGVRNKIYEHRGW